MPGRAGAAAAAALLLGAASALAQSAPAPQPGADLRPASSFAGIADQRDRSVALFNEIGKVLLHPRCVNCHPATERPRQGDARRLHQPMVVRGKDGHGAPGLACATCHGKQNFDPAGIPGDGHWALAPAAMAWEGRTLGQICEQLKDLNRNGSRDLAAIVRHVTADTLVLWGWNPGKGREPAPGTNAQFGELMQAWVDSGAACPAV
ncbi:Isoquinoline 1-oxidoreductase subunit [Bosea sp. CS1GBMeth4]|uniref:Isoquinoline 1-oxidoreductase subunit n=1 Tax=Bosea sp. CS1GBMeth4 TaxID=1892849 RepID=UPI0016483FA5|nr:Isoquinoline 1-oxidoreductase subunit [Bosea sp. CS1GBMeth4]